MDAPRQQIAVLGAATCNAHLAQLAYDVGSRLAQAGATLVCGGRGGVMEAASRGAREAGGLVVGVLPGVDANASPPNPHLDVAIFTGMGQARNLAVVLSASAVIAVGGSWGTLSEIAMARKHEIPVVLLESWTLERPDCAKDSGLHLVGSAEEAVEVALQKGP